MSGDVLAMVDAGPLYAAVDEDEDDYHRSIHRLLSLICCAHESHHLDCRLMSVDLHRQAEALMAQGDLHARKCEFGAAASCYQQAAALEATVWEQIPAERGRTRGIIAVSAVALYWRAAQISQDIEPLAKLVDLANFYLTCPDLLPFAQEQLEDLLIEGKQELEARQASRLA